MFALSMLLCLFLAIPVTKSLLNNNTSNLSVSSVKEILLVCANTENKYLCIQENGKWTLPSTIIEDDQHSIYDTIKLNTFRSTGVDVELKGLVKVETSNQVEKVILVSSVIKVHPVKDQSTVAWFTLAEISQLKDEWKSDDIHKWPSAIEGGIVLQSLDLLIREGSTNDVGRNHQNGETDKLHNVSMNFKCDSSTKNCVTADRVAVAIMTGDDTAVQTALTQGFDPNTIINKFDWTPLHLAIKQGNVKVISMLLIKEANIGAQTDDGRNCVHFAAQEDITILNAILVKLMEYDYKLRILNHQDEIHGNSPLHYSAELSKKDQRYILNYQILLSVGADPNLKNKEGMTAEELIKQ